MIFYDEFEKTVHGPWKTAGMDVQYRIEVEGLLIKVYFQHTRSRLDWLIDLNCLPVETRSGTQWEHRGYFTAFMSAYTEVMSEVFLAIDGRLGVEIEVYGYSMGGPYAAKFSDILSRMGWTVYAYTFASPRWLWRRDLTYMPVTNFRVRGDLLAAAFPRWAGFRDAGVNVWIGEPSRLSLKNHTTDRYREELKKL